jgi:hypothetical protein
LLSISTNQQLRCLQTQNDIHKSEFNRFEVVKFDKKFEETKNKRMKMTEIAGRMKGKCVFLVGGKCWKIGMKLSDREHAQHHVNKQISRAFRFQCMSFQFLASCLSGSWK